MKKLIRSLVVLFALFLPVTAFGATLEGVSLNAQSQFIFDIKTTGADETFTLPIYNGGTYDFHIDWGDAGTDAITAWDDAAVTHTYVTAGTYQVVISGVITGWRFNDGGDKLKIYEIKSWGPLNFGNLGYNFYGCTNLTVSATDVLDLVGVTTLNTTFRNCSSLTTLDVSNWDVGLVTNLFYTFNGCSSLTTLDVSNWDVGLVTKLGFTFRGCSSLTTLDVSNWDVGLVTNLYYTFYGCSSLTSLDVSNWDVGLVTSLSTTFYGCSSLTDPAINNWDIHSVTDATNFMNSAKPLSTSVYDATLIAYDAQPVQDNVTIHFGTSKYTGGGAAAAARAALIADHGWIISDGGQTP